MGNCQLGFISLHSIFSANSSARRQHSHSLVPSHDFKNQNTTSHFIMMSATRCIAALYLALFLPLLNTFPYAYAAADTKVANRTIERVSSFWATSGRAWVPFSPRTHAEGVRGTYAHVPYSLQTVQLRTHSIHPPYIDEDLQNRYAVRVMRGPRTTAY